MGISHSRVQQLERSDSPLSEDMKQKFQKAVDVSEADWKMLKGGDEGISEIKLECIQRIYSLGPEHLSKLTLFLRNLSLVAVFKLGLDMGRLWG